MLVDPQRGQKRLVYLSVDIVAAPACVGFSVESEFGATTFWAGAEDPFFKDSDAFEFSFSELGEVDPAVVFPPLPDIVAEGDCYFRHVMLISRWWEFEVVGDPIGYVGDDCFIYMSWCLVFCVCWGAFSIDK